VVEHLLAKEDVASSSLVTRSKMITLYVLEGLTTRRHYVGITNNLERRLLEHKNGTSHSGRLIGPFRLLHTEFFQTYVAAREREKFLKSGQGREWLKRNVLR
jgi:putative endonuclease